MSSSPFYTGPTPVLVMLSADDLNLIHALAGKRNAGKDQSPKMGGGPALAANVLGLYGEVAFARYSGLPIDLSITPSGDAGFDFLSQNNKRIEIKTRDTATRAIPDLMVSLHKARADVYILAECNPISSSTVGLVGWCSHEELLSNKIKNRYGWRYIVQRDLLHPLPKEYPKR